MTDERLNELEELNKSEQYGLTKHQGQELIVEVRRLRDLLDSKNEELDLVPGIIKERNDLIEAPIGSSDMSEDAAHFALLVANQLREHALATGFEFSFRTQEADR